MATLAIAAGGALLGGAGFAAAGWAVTTGIALGWTVGAYVGNELFGGPDMQDVEGPRLGDLTVQSSAYGRDIPRIYGCCRIAGNIIWSGGIEEHKHEEEMGGGKGGGGGATSTTYTYTASFAIGLCEGEIVGIRRMWADGKLIFDSSENKSFAQKMADSEKMDGVTVYTGTETQEPDPVIESYEQSGTVPAYRGLAYIVFDNLKLQDYGNRIPNIEVELAQQFTEHDLIFDLSNYGVWVFDYFNNGMIIFGRRDNYFYSDPSRIEVYSGAVDGQLIYQDYSTGGKNIGHLNESPIEAEDLYTTDTLGPEDLCCYREVYPYNTLPGNNMCFFAQVNEAVYYFDATDGNMIDAWRIPGSGSCNGFDVGYIPGIGFGHISSVSTNVYVHRLYWGMKEGEDGNMVQGVCKQEIDHFVHENKTAYFTQLDHIRINPFDHKIYVFFEYDQIGFSTVIYDCVDKNNQLFVFADYNDFKSFLLYGNESWETKIQIEEPGGHIWDMTHSDNNDLVIHRGSGLCVVYDGPIGPNIRKWYDSPEPDDPVTIASIVADIFDQEGISSYDVSDLNNDTAIGFAVTKQMTGRSILQPLMKAYQFDIVECDWQLKCVKRGAAEPRDIPDSALAAVEGEGSDFPVELKITRTLERELPRELVVEYQDYDLDYQVNAQRAVRQSTNSENKKTLRFPLVMKATQALQGTEALFTTAWMQQHQYNFVVSSAFIDLLPGNVVNVKDQRILIQGINFQYPGLLEVSGVREDIASYISESQAESPSFEGQIISTGGTALGYIVELPYFNENSNSFQPGFFAAMYSVKEGWPGAVVKKSVDGGVSWTDVGFTGKPAVVGKTTSKLSDGSTTRWDRKNSVTIQIESADTALYSTTEASALAGDNTLAIGYHDRWEILSFTDVVDEGDGRYTISNLIRGRRGTEKYTNKHVKRDLAILLTDALVWIPITEERIDTSVLYKFVTFGQLATKAIERDYTCKAIRLKPYDPVHIKGTRNESGDLHITWFRRSRIAMNWGPSDVPLSENEESYEIDILDTDGTVLRTITTDGNGSDQDGVTYNASDQTTDFGSTQSSIDIKIYQMSDVVGRGYPGEATV